MSTPTRGADKELNASRIPGSGKREKIKVFYGPGIVPFRSREENKTEIMGASVERFKKRFKHHLAFILNKLAVGRTQTPGKEAARHDRPERPAQCKERWQ